ncbi:MAG: M36 family metallopeptidase, partial [Acidobacteriota bacterium]
MSSARASLSLLACLLVLASSATARPRLPNRDLRYEGRVSGPTWTPQQELARQRLLEVLPVPVGPGRELVVRPGGRVGELQHLFVRGGRLTAPPTGETVEQAARRFLGTHHELFATSADQLRRLSVSARREERDARATHLFLQQRVDDLPVLGAELRLHHDRDGALVSVSGGLQVEHRLDDGRFVLSPEEAVQAAARSLRFTPSAEPRLLGRGHDGKLELEVAGSSHPVLADRCWFPVDDGLLPAWRLFLDSPVDGGTYRVVVHAGDGRLLSRLDLVQEIATSGLVFPLDPGSGAQESLDFVDDTVNVDEASPAGWTFADETIGNNVHVQDDLDGDDATLGLAAQATSGPDPLAFDHAFTGTVETDLAASSVNLFYWVNWTHDRLWHLGFDEAAGNFQQDNFGRGGLGGDPIIVDVQDSIGLNNANFRTLPDGRSPRTQFFNWNRSGELRDGGFDVSVIIHEFGHGLSNRLVDGPTQTGCLRGGQPGALGEGWSDFLAASFLDRPIIGAWSVENFDRGLRRYTFDVHPVHYGELCGDGPFSVHRDGEVWAATLWDLRDLFMDRHGVDTGRCRFERLVVDAMKLTPCRPSYVDARDALLLAAELHGEDGDRCLLWEGFAARGLGASARVREDCTDVEDASFAVPPQCLECTLPGPVVEETITSDNTVTLRFTPVAGAREHALLRSDSACGDCYDAEFIEVARVGPGRDELVDVDGVNGRLSAGETFSYRIVARDFSCTSYSPCQTITIEGRCTQRPQAADGQALGVLQLGRVPQFDCQMDLTWVEAEAACGDAADLVYNVYRSADPDFEPASEHLVAVVPAPATTWSDVAAPAATSTWVVRAEDLTAGGAGPNGGNEETNDRRLTLEPLGRLGPIGEFLDDSDGERPDGQDLSSTLAGVGWERTAGPGDGDAW